MSEQDCTVQRWDVEPRYAPMTGPGTFDPPACDHEICAEDIRLHDLGAEHRSHWECPSGRCRLDRCKAQCERVAGHDGAHAWEDVGVPVLSEWTRLPMAAGARP